MFPVPDPAVRSLSETWKRFISPKRKAVLPFAQQEPNPRSWRRGCYIRAQKGSLGHGDGVHGVFPENWGS